MQETRDTHDLLGRPLPIDGRQRELPLPLPSRLDDELERDAQAWRQNRCPQTGDLFPSSLTPHKES